MKIPEVIAVARNTGHAEQGPHTLDHLIDEPTELAFWRWSVRRRDQCRRCQKGQGVDEEPHGRAPYLDQPAASRRWLDYVAPAVLAALVAPTILVTDRVLAPPRLELLAFVATFVVALLTRRMLPSLAAGVAVLIAIVLVHG